ncbi:hypothetical protein BCR39DRAFT_557389 [Naematelia encephala]|uniref:Ketoreductase domain-containing protein n=1 Tax=Naematelia encephala TaxID=71784 RepID=A0A1Y2BDP2_9TREE|nr:hypothetical protein BCR39DRAFT_557389 [Naematelia encephala]
MPTILITGANRGIGLQFAQRYAKQGGYKVVVAVRDVSKMPKIEGVQVITIDSSTTTGAKEGVEELKKLGIDKLDVVIANAAVNLTNAPFSEVSTADLDMTYYVNIRGVVVLFQAVLPLLPKSTGKFIVISSGAGTINKPEMGPGQGAYAMSKAAINFVVRKMHFENPDYLIAGFSPGWVKTDMGNQGAQWAELEGGVAPEDINETVPGMMELIAAGDREKLGGWMTNWNGDRMEF